MRKPVRALAVLSASALALGLSGMGATALAAPADKAGMTTIAGHIAGPLSLGVADDGTVFVSADMAGQLLEVDPGQAAKVVYQDPEKHAEVGAVSVSGNRVVFATTGAKKKVYEMVGGAAPVVIANVGRFEKANNPDHSNHYGFQGLSKSCIAQLPKNQEIAPYKGVVDSHPYSSAQDGTTTYIGEAAGNDILAINGGKISVVAVLPPTPVKVSAKAVTANHLPACLAGHTINLEPVPTDVEVGPDGWLYVSSLPGGPEDGSLGPQGRVYKVNPATGKVRLVARGFISTVDLAVAANGDVYVAQLFTGQISRIKAGTKVAKPFLQLPQPAAIEVTDDAFYISSKALMADKKGNPLGKVVRVAR